MLLANILCREQVSGRIAQRVTEPAKFLILSAATAGNHWCAKMAEIIFIVPKDVLTNTPKQGANRTLHFFTPTLILEMNHGSFNFNEAQSHTRKQLDKGESGEIS